MADKEECGVYFVNLTWQTPEGPGKPHMKHPLPASDISYYSVIFQTIFLFNF